MRLYQIVQLLQLLLMIISGRQRVLLIDCRHLIGLLQVALCVHVTLTAVIDCSRAEQDLIALTIQT